MTTYKKTLSNLEAPYLQELNQLVQMQDKKTLILWAVDYSEQVMIPLWKKYHPDDSRPMEALEAARLWVEGTIKLPTAKTVILRCHQAAREVEGNPAAQGVARAIAHSASTIHSARHSIGLALYGALALAYDQLGFDAPWQELEQTASIECKKMLFALQQISKNER